MSFILHKTGIIYQIECLPFQRRYVGKTIAKGAIYDLTDISRLNQHFAALRDGKHSNALMASDWMRCTRDDYSVSILEVVHFDQFIIKHQLEGDYEGAQSAKFNRYLLDRELILMFQVDAIYNHQVRMAKAMSLIGELGYESVEALVTAIALDEVKLIKPD